MKPITRYVLQTLAIVLAGLILTGCAMWPTSYRDARTGYVVTAYREAQAKGKEKEKLTPELQRYARQVADETLRTLTPGKTLPEVKAYVAALEQPYVIDVAALPAPTEKVPETWDRIRQWAGTRGGFQFNGADWSPAWAQALKQAQQQATELEDKLKQLATTAQQQLGRGEFAKAIQAWEASLAIDPTSATAKDEIRQVRRQWVGAEFEKLLPVLRAARERVQAGTQNYHTPNSSEKLVADLLASVDQAQLKVDEFRAWAQQNDDFIQAHLQNAPAIHAEETALAVLRGRAWGENLWLRGQANRFWDAYQYHTAVWEQSSVQLPGGKVHRFEEHEQKGLREELRKAYEEMLPPGLAYLNRHGQTRASEGRYGVTVVLLRMGQELFDYHHNLGFTGTPAVQELQRQLNFALKDATGKLHKLAIDRRILLGEFKGQGEHAANLAARVFDRWIEKYTSTGPRDEAAIFYGVKMEKATTERGGLDYEITCHLAGLYVDTRPPKNLKSTDLYIGRTPERLTSDQIRRERLDSEKAWFSQDIHVYDQREIQHVKEATVKATVRVVHQGETRLLVALDEKFDGLQKLLPGAKLVGTEVSYRPISSKTKILEERDLIKVGAVPIDTPHNLPPDRDIEQTLLDYTTNRILAELQTQVTQFPLQHFVRQAVLAGKQGKPVEAADYFGQCLEYVFQLTVNDKSAPQLPDWPATRKAILAKVDTLNKTVWEKENLDLKVKMGDIWEQAVAAALALLKP